MTNQIPTYMAWNVGSDETPRVTHWVVFERTDKNAIITSCPKVADLGSVSLAVFDSPTQRRAYEIAKEMNQKSFDEHISGKKFTRYLTRSYVSVDKAECARHMQIDNTPLDQIKITPDLEILHIADEWLWWSDGRFSTGIGVSLPKGGCLSEDAMRIISAVRGSDGGSCYLDGGMKALADIQRIVGEKYVSVGPSRGHYARETVEELTIEWKDGATGPIYVHTAGYFEGYMYDIYPSLDSLRQHASIAPGPEGINEFPADDYDYDPKLGYVAKQQED